MFGWICVCIQLCFAIVELFVSVWLGLYWMCSGCISVYVWLRVKLGFCVIIPLDKNLNSYPSIKAMEEDSRNLIGKFLLWEVVSSSITVEIKTMIE